MGNNMKVGTEYRAYFFYIKKEFCYICNLLEKLAEVYG